MEKILFVVTEKILTYRATNEDVELLDKNNLRFTDFCKKGFNRLKNGTKQEYFDRVLLRMLVVIFGCVIFIFSWLLGNPFSILIGSGMGIFITAFGSFALVLMILEKNK
jgi:hypothetical protein